MVSSDNQEASLIWWRDAFEFASKLFAWLIVVGLVVELFMILRDHPFWPDAVEKLSGTFLILVGVAGEIIFSANSGKAAETLRHLSEMKVAQADARAKEADQKASEARLELAKFMAPRTITVMQQERIIELISPFADACRGTRGVTVGASPETHESSSLASEIVLTLRRSGIATNRHDNGVKFQVGLVSGIVVRFMNGGESGSQLAMLLTHALNAEGLSATHQDNLVELASAGRDLSEIKDEKDVWIIVAIGDKPITDTVTTTNADK